MEGIEKNKVSISLEFFVKKIVEIKILFSVFLWQRVQLKEFR